MLGKNISILNQIIKLLHVYIFLEEKTQIFKRIRNRRKKKWQSNFKQF